MCFFKTNFSTFLSFQKKQGVFMLVINVKESETIDRALSRYKKKVKDTQLMKEVRRRKNFEKPSVVRRAVVLKAIHRESVKLQEQND